MKALIGGYFGYGNLGDELILSSVVDQLKSKYGSVAATVLSGNPKKTVSLHALRSVSRWNPFTIFAEMWDNDVFIMAGGLFQDYTSAASMLYYVGLIFMARTAGCPVVLYGLGVEPISNPFCRWLAGRALRDEGVRITVRDQQSKDILVRLGVSPPSVAVTGDPVLCRSVETIPPERYAAKRARVLFIPRFPCPASGVEIYAKVLSQIKSTTGFDVKGLLFQPARERKGLLSARDNFSLEDFIPEPPLSDLPQVVQRFDYVVSARFHGLVLAALAGRPFLGIGESSKTGRFCSSYGMPYVSWTAPDIEIKKALDVFFTQKPRIDERTLAEMRTRAFRTLDHVS